MVAFLQANGATPIEVPEGGFSDSDADSFGALDDDEADEDGDAVEDAVEDDGEDDGEDGMGSGAGEGAAGSEEEKDDGVAESKEST